LWEKRDGTERKASLKEERKRVERFKWEKRDGTGERLDLKNKEKGREILVGKERWDRGNASLKE
jgi:hypothetical protein